MKQAVLVLAVSALALALAQTPPEDTASRAEVVLTAKQALEAASQNLNRWLTVVVLAALAAAALVVWRVWALGHRLQRLDDMRAAWDTRFADTTDEVLRLKRKLAEEANAAARLEADIASLRPAALDAASAQVAMVQSELVATRERLDRLEGRLEAMADHTVAAGQERVAIEDLVKAADRARSAAESAATRAEVTARRTAAADALRAGDAKLAQGQYAAAAQAYAECLESLAAGEADDPVMRFNALHNRAVANLRQRELDAVLADAAALRNVAHERAPGASRLLTGIARLWQGAVAQALEDFSAAVESDPGARAAILRDEDIAAWVKAHPGKAAPVRRFVKSAGKAPAKPKRPSTRKKPAGARPKPGGRTRR